MSSGKFDLDQIAKHDNLKAKFTVDSAEDPDEKRVRLHKDKASFWAKEVGPLIFAATILLLAAIACLVVIFRPSSFTPIDRDNAWKALNLIVGAALGTIFGKLTTK